MSIKGKVGPDWLKVEIVNIINFERYEWFINSFYQNDKHTTQTQFVVQQAPNTTRSSETRKEQDQPGWVASIHALRKF